MNIPRIHFQVPYNQLAKETQGIYSPKSAYFPLESILSFNKSSLCFLDLPVSSLNSFCEETRTYFLVTIGHVDAHQKNQDQKLTGTSLVAQWLRIHLPIQGTWVQALVREELTCHGATKAVCHNYWACIVEPTSHNYWAHMPQLLKPVCLEPMLCNKRSHCNEKPALCNEE